ncbi:hypothetical protein HHI36_017928 [Cryptolaemus montrouzieri]|uniref:Uncharacterized protein n=1 Tax=Cryptolaemus montrouzieri TaxID=559131 RepID=A0ABD2NYQ0_9CUCU
MTLKMKFPPPCHLLTCRLKPDRHLLNNASIWITSLEKVPKMPSHYCLKSTSIVYVQNDIQSKSHLFRIYKENCEENYVEGFSRYTFELQLRRERVGIFQQCDLCMRYQHKNVSEEIYLRHSAFKTRAQA